MDTPRTNRKEMSDGGEKKKEEEGGERGNKNKTWKGTRPDALWMEQSAATTPACSSLGGLAEGGRTHDGVQETRSSSGLLPGSMLIVGD